MSENSRIENQLLDILGEESDMSGVPGSRIEALIEEIKELLADGGGSGSRLYGPYVAMNAEAVDVNVHGPVGVSLMSLIDLDSGETVYHPAGTFQTFLHGIWSQGLAITHVNCPTEYEYAEIELQIIPPPGSEGFEHVSIDAGTIGVVFFSNVEFPTVENQDS